MIKNFIPAIVGAFVLSSTPVYAQRSTQTGIASWYGRDFHNKYVANYPEKFNMYANTAASNTFPLGSCVNITNLRNGKTVRGVRINDTGGFTRLGRVIDVSYGVANRLGFVTAGLTRVRIVKTHSVSRRSRKC